MAKRADNFKAAVRDQIMERAGYRCAFPSCRKLTHGPKNKIGSTNIGVAAHIAAASPNGPRYDKQMTPDERSSESNGLWMCEIHGKLIDKDDSSYSTELLTSWKRAAETRALQEMHGGLSHSPVLAAKIKTCWENDIIEKCGLGMLLELQSFSEELINIKSVFFLIEVPHEVIDTALEAYTDEKIEHDPLLPPPYIGHACATFSDQNLALSYKQTCEFFIPVMAQSPVYQYYKDGFEFKIECNTHNSTENILTHENIVEHYKHIVDSDLFAEQGNRFFDNKIIVQQSSRTKRKSPPVGKYNDKEISF
jgi:hypothetical protein